MRSAASFSACSASALAAAMRSAAARAASFPPPAAHRRGHRRGGGGRRSRGAGGGTRALALAALGELGRQVVALLGQPPQLGDDLVEEVVDLLLVVAAPELGRREVLVEDILRSERHVVTSVEPVRDGTTVANRGAAPGVGGAGRVLCESP
jgi:hypothetical protein